MTRTLPIFFVLIFWASAWATAQAAEILDPCAGPAMTQERRHGIPEGLLRAISLTESGRWDERSRASIAWPWTVTAKGEGRFLPSKDAAIAEVERLKAEGVRNIDVGCMQVNLQYHPDAFKTLDEAFDPASNVAYAARFLTNLHAASGEWTTAATRYHSHTPHLAASYQRKLAKLWRGGGAPAPGVENAFARAALVREESRRKSAAEREAARLAAEAHRAGVLAEYLGRRGVGRRR